MRKDIENLCDKLQEVDLENRSVTQVEIDDLCDGINNVLIKPAIPAGIISTYTKFHHHLPYSTGYFAVYCVPGSTPVPQNPMNVMVIVMVNVMVKSTA